MSMSRYVLSTLAPVFLVTFSIHKGMADSAPSCDYANNEVFKQPLVKAKFNLAMKLLYFGAFSATRRYGAYTYASWLWN